jgi:hypothetical protein
MKTRTLVIGGITITALVAGGWALAQTAGHPDGFGPRSMRGEGPAGMGPGMMKGMGPGMMKGMGGHGPGMVMKGMGHGPGMMRQRHGAAFADPGTETPESDLGITADRGVRDEDRTGER